MPEPEGRKHAVPVARSMHPANWAILVLPFGIAVGYLQVAMPYVLRLRGVDMAVIGAISATANMPHALKFLWAPVLDSGWPRKNWFFLMVGVTAAALALASLIPPDASQRLGPVSMLALYTAVLTVAQAAVATSSSAVLGITATVVPERREGPCLRAGRPRATSRGRPSAAPPSSGSSHHTSPQFTAVLLAGALPRLRHPRPSSSTSPRAGEAGAAARWCSRS